MSTMPTSPLTSVLIVDDEPAVRALMAHWATSMGLLPRTAASADEALEALETERYDLAVVDMMMPGHDGLWLANRLRRDHPQLAVVIATAYTELIADDPDSPEIADLLIKPFQRDRFALAVDRGRSWRKQMIEELQWRARLAVELQDRVARICTEVQDACAHDPAGERDTLLAMARARVPEIAAHGERVARFAASIARALGCVDETAATLEPAARFHDIGKLAIPEALLTKPSPLGPGENEIMRKHVDAGADILASTRTLTGLAPLVLASHEWFGGGGYPHRLSGLAIPLASRIVAVADAFDAMTQNRSYRVRLNSSDAVAELLRCSPSQFDPEIVVALLSVIGTPLTPPVSLASGIGTSHERTLPGARAGKLSANKSLVYNDLPYPTPMVRRLPLCNADRFAFLFRLSRKQPWILLARPMPNRSGSSKGSTPASACWPSCSSASGSRG